MSYPGEYDVEAPEADAAEQSVRAYPGRFDGDDADMGTIRDAEAPEWDVHEQRQVLDDADDDYR